MWIFPLYFSEFPLYILREKLHPEEALPGGSQRWALCFWKWENRVDGISLQANWIATSGFFCPPPNIYWLQTSYCNTLLAHILVTIIQPCTTYEYTNIVHNHHTTFLHFCIHTYWTKPSYNLLQLPHTHILVTTIIQHCSTFTCTFIGYNHHTIL